MTTIVNTSTQDILQPVKRGRGRPRIHPLPDPNAPPKKLGKPLLGDKPRDKTWYYHNRPDIREQILAQQSVSVDCECGAYVTRSNMGHHKRSIKHIEYIKSKKQ